MNINLKNLNKLTEVNLNTKLTFGKYKGETIDNITQFDSSYIIYLYTKKLINPDKELLKQIKQTIKQKEEEYEWDSIFG